MTTATARTATEQKLQVMDSAARLASTVLRDMEKDGRLAPGIKAIKQWWLHNYRQAGHKRLGHCLLGIVSDTLEG